MPITANHLIANGNGADQNSYATASISPGSYRMVVVAVMNFEPAFPVPVVPSLSGNGLTYTALQTVLTAANVRLTVYRALGINAPSAGAITIDCGGVTQSGCEWHVTEFIDAQEIIQAVQDSGLVETSWVITMADSGFINDAMFGAFINEVGGTVTPGTGFTELADTVVVIPTFTEWRNTNATIIDASRAVAANWAGIGLELRIRTSLPFVPPQRRIINQLLARGY